MSTIRSITNDSLETHFRLQLTCTPRCLIGPGVFDGISTHIASTIGFDFLYLTGTGATGSVTGQPDLSVMTATEYAELARMMAYTTHLPIIADADTGFGGPINIQRIVHLYESAGIAGIRIEDQTFPKRCGQLSGKTVESLEVNADNFDGEKAGRDAFQEGVRRLQEALKAGADVAFMESPRSIEECKQLVEACKLKPVLINILPNGLTPQLTTEQCTELGFKAAIYPCTGFIPAMLAMQESYRALKEKGTDLECCGGKRVTFLNRWGWRRRISLIRMLRRRRRERHRERRRRGSRFGNAGSSFVRSLR
ncbi:Pyruvate/Phosphoenolpyruvate kinase-like domain-containing protein [Trichophaea hybrida]|nr:Pyruvate/Phosphoenolpyruvate kinase-like domain-containing protein [Trichophaea hybrida]